MSLGSLFFQPLIIYTDPGNHGLAAEGTKKESSQHSAVNMKLDLNTSSCSEFQYHGKALCPELCHRFSWKCQK